MRGSVLKEIRLFCKLMPPGDRRRQAYADAKRTWEMTPKNERGAKMKKMKAQRKMLEGRIAVARLEELARRQQQQQEKTK